MHLEYVAKYVSRVCRYLRLHGVCVRFAAPCLALRSHERRAPPPPLPASRHLPEARALAADHADGRLQAPGQSHVGREKGGASFRCTTVSQNGVTPRRGSGDLTEHRPLAECCLHTLPPPPERARSCVWHVGGGPSPSLVKCVCEDRLRATAGLAYHVSRYQVSIYLCRVCM